MFDVIELRDLRCEAIVGVLPHERHEVQPLSFDIDVARPFGLAAANDDLSHTTNYAVVLTRTCEVAVAGQFLLLETLVRRVAEAILELDQEISSVTVVVRKLRPPVPERVATVGVRCTLDREP